jgi:quinol-cytochrome oxidoreductase complex cytochrome b subunit
VNTALPRGILRGVLDSDLPPPDAKRAAMIRPILTELTLFVTPFVLYALYLWATREGVLDMSAWSAPRLIWLSIAALVLVIISFVLLAQFGGAPPGSTYVPAHMENGRLVPGAER